MGISRPKIISVTEEEETAPNPGPVVESQTSSFADCVIAAFARWVRRTTDRHFSGVFTKETIDDKNRKLAGRNVLRLRILQ